MTKNELIEKLQSIEGDPQILLNDAELGCIPLRNVKTGKFHQEAFDEDKYVTEDEFESERGFNTYYHDNYRAETEECILLSL